MRKLIVIGVLVMVSVSCNKTKECECKNSNGTYIAGETKTRKSCKKLSSGDTECNIK